MLVMPDEAGSVIKHDITDATSASLRKTDPTSESFRIWQGGRLFFVQGRIAICPVLSFAWTNV